MRLTETDELLSERTTGLSAAQAFLARADAWDRREPASGTHSEEPDVERIRDYFDNSMVEQIAARNSAINLAIQTCLGYFIEQVTSGWGGGQAAGTLAEIYTMTSTKGKLGACA